MRHQHAGLAIPDFPMAYGKAWPQTDPVSIERYNQQRLEIVAVKPITAGQIHLQMTHRFVALLILLAVGYSVWRTAKQIHGKNFWTVSAFVWAGIIMTQVVLGAATIWSEKAADIATAHVFFGALSLAHGSLICIVSIHAAKSIIKIKPAARTVSDSSRKRFGSQTSAAN
ncbi:Heme A synthase [bioreactor metagenome]|uniref:Heme A synthase n=1 Tax=bioreactor metagenome TaxID=1076179 RepID=A0A645F174_9ZZZZ